MTITEQMPLTSWEPTFGTLMTAIGSFTKGSAPVRFLVQTLFMNTLQELGALQLPIRAHRAELKLALTERQANRNEN